MNFSISEILLIVVVALLVIKPEQLPDVAFTLGRFTQSMRRMFAKIKDEMHGFIDSVDLTSTETHTKSLHTSSALDPKASSTMDTTEVSSEQKREQSSSS